MITQGRVRRRLAGFLPALANFVSPLAGARLPLTNFRIALAGVRPPLTNFRIALAGARPPLTNFRIPLAGACPALTSFRPALAGGGGNFARGKAGPPEVEGPLRHPVRASHFSVSATPGRSANQRRHRAALTAASPSSAGEALNAASIPCRAAGVCMRSSSSSNLGLSASALPAVPSGVSPSLSMVTSSRPQS
jgi:hypothetical protein